MTSGPLTRLFSRQQPKVKHSLRKAALLKTFADNDLDVIASLIQKWLDEENAKSERVDPSAK